VLVSTASSSSVARRALTKEWFDLSPCKYDAPRSYVAALLDQNIAGEQCAISSYKG